MVMCHSTIRFGGSSLHLWAILAPYMYIYMFSWLISCYYTCSGTINNRGLSNVYFSTKSGVSLLKYTSYDAGTLFDKHLLSGLTILT